MSPSSQTGAVVLTGGGRRRLANRECAPREAAWRSERDDESQPLRITQTGFEGGLRVGLLCVTESFRVWTAKPQVLADTATVPFVVDSVALPVTERIVYRTLTTSTPGGPVEDECGRGRSTAAGKSDAPHHCASAVWSDARRVP